MLSFKDDNNASHINDAFKALVRQIPATEEGELRTKCISIFTKYIFDIQYLVALAEAGFVRELAQYFKYITDWIPPKHPDRHLAQLFSLCITLHSDFLERHPQMLFQTLWNECWWHDCPNLMAHLPIIPNQSLKDVPYFSVGPHVSTTLENWKNLILEKDPEAMMFKRLSPPFSRLYPGSPQELRGHTEVAERVTLSASGSLALSCSSNNEVLLWDVAGGGAKQRIDNQFSEKSTAASITSDGLTIVLATPTGTINFWDVAAAVPKGTLQISEFDGYCSCVANDSDSQRVVFFTNEGRIIVINADLMQVVHDIAFGSIPGPPQVCRFVSNTNLLYVAFGNGDIYSVDLATSRIEPLFNVMKKSHGQPYPLQSMSLTRDGRLLAVSGCRGKIIVVDMEQRRTIQEFSVGKEEGLSDQNAHIPVFSYILPNGEGIVYSILTTIWRLDLQTGTHVRPLYNHQAFIHDLVISNSGHAASAGSDRMVVVSECAEATADKLPRQESQFVGGFLIDKSNETLIEIASGGPMFVPTLGGSMSMTMPIANAYRAYSTNTGRPRPVFIQHGGEIVFASTMDMLSGIGGLVYRKQSVKVKADGTPWAISVDLETSLQISHSAQGCESFMEQQEEECKLASDANELKLLSPCKTGPVRVTDGNKTSTYEEIAWFPSYWQRGVVCESGSFWAGTSSMSAELLRYIKLADDVDQWTTEDWNQAIAGKMPPETLFGAPGLPTADEVSYLVPFAFIAFAIRVSELSLAASRVEAIGPHQELMVALRRLDRAQVSMILQGNSPSYDTETREHFAWLAACWSAASTIDALAGREVKAIEAIVESCYRAACVDRALVRWIRIDYSRLLVAALANQWTTKDQAPLSFFGHSR